MKVYIFQHFSCPKTTKEKLWALNSPLHFLNQIAVKLWYKIQRRGAQQISIGSLCEFLRWLQNNFYGRAKIFSMVLTHPRHNMCLIRAWKIEIDWINEKLKKLGVEIFLCQQVTTEWSWSGPKGHLSMRECQRRIISVLVNNNISLIRARHGLSGVREMNVWKANLNVMYSHSQFIFQDMTAERKQSYS